MEPTLNRVVLITGAAGGLGSVMTMALIEDGHAVAAVDRDAAALARLEMAHRAAGFRGKLVTIQADIASTDECRRAMGIACDSLGRLDGLINNAGIGSSSLAGTAIQSRPAISEIDVGEWDRFFAVNVRAPMLLTQLALPHMRNAGRGRVVNITTSYRSMLGALPYGATKSALESMSAVWTTEFAKDRIDVTVLIPGGPTDTAFVSDIGMPRENMLRPTIMAAPVRWLFSDAANGFTGHRITAGRWDSKLPPSEAAKQSSRLIGWPELAGDAIWGVR